MAAAFDVATRSSRFEMDFIIAMVLGGEVIAASSDQDTDVKTSYIESKCQCFENTLIKADKSYVEE
jgi:hypothetical protein